jgi:hypothetical protein
METKTVSSVSDKSSSEMLLSESVEQDPVKEPSSERTEPSWEVNDLRRQSLVQVRGDWGGVGRAGAVCSAGPANVEHLAMHSLSSPMVILVSGVGSNILPRMLFSSSDKGKMVFKKSRFLVNARYVESSREACFHGLRPHVRLTRITPRDQMSLGAHRYAASLDDGFRHSTRG